ncbi:MAG: tetratricopeptide repeat protein [Pseudomonadota bacterium]
MLWAIFGVMAAGALAAIVWPLYRSEQRVTARAAVVGLCVLVVSGALYQRIGQPNASTVAAESPDVDEMVASLSARLEREPNDIAGWKMLGRSYSVMRRYSDAVAAYERAVELEGSSNGQTIVDLGEAVLMNDGRTLAGRAGELFESALAVAPGNPKALFYSGLAAAERGDQLLAADRWEELLVTSPPPEIESVLTQRIAEWRGEAEQGSGEPVDSNLTIELALATDAQASIPADATVFVIARDPDQPSPPIAVARRKADELPLQLTLSDADAMIPGRKLSAFKDVEIVSRASISGQPIAQSGDWFGSVQIDTSATRNLSIVIDKRVP